MFFQQLPYCIVFRGKLCGQKLLDFGDGALGACLGNQKSLIVFSSLRRRGKPGQRDRLILKEQQTVAQSGVSRQQYGFQKPVVCIKVFLHFPVVDQFGIAEELQPFPEGGLKKVGARFQRICREDFITLFSDAFEG